MDRQAWDAWIAGIAGPGAAVWATLRDACDRQEGGRRTAWTLNLLRALACAAPDRDEDDDLARRLPTDPEAMRAALAPHLAPLSPARRARALRWLRAALDGAGPPLAAAAAALPRHWRREPAPVLARQTRVVNTDSLPRGPHRPWVEALFRDLLRANRETAWRTSATARQELALCHKFLRSTGWLDRDFPDLAAFEAFVRGTLSVDDLVACANRFTDTLCRSEASAQRYRHVFRLLFVRQWRCLTDADFRGHVLGRCCRRPSRDVERPEDLEALSERSSAAGHRTGAAAAALLALADREFHFTVAEEARLRAACAGPRDRLVLEVLVTTGLRRRGFLNILTESVAYRAAAAADGGGPGRWVARDRGTTLTKKRRLHTFLLHHPARVAIEAWLNTPEGAGGRPRHPSAFLVPSARTDDGQLSVSSLARWFGRLCARAGIPRSTGKCHLHALRHTHAHRLREAKNEARVITASLGHRDPKTTSLYLRDAMATVAEGMTLPAGWGAPPPPKRRSSSDHRLAHEVLREWKRQQQQQRDGT